MAWTGITRAKYRRDGLRRLGHMLHSRIYMACKISAKSATQRSSPERSIPPLTTQAMHQDELTYRPTDSIDHLFGTRFQIWACDGNKNTFVKMNSQFEGRFSCRFNQCFGVRFTQIGPSWSKTIIVDTAQRIFWQKIDVIFNDHKICKIQLRITAMSSSAILPLVGGILRTES